MLHAKHMNAAIENIYGIIVSISAYSLPLILEDKRLSQKPFKTYSRKDTKFAKADNQCAFSLRTLRLCVK